MKNDSKGIVAGVVFVICFLLVLAIIGSSGPKCSMSGCDKDQKEGSRYCYLHDMSYRSYGNPDYNAVYENAQKRRESKTTSYSSGSSTSGSPSGTSKTNKSTTTKKKTYSTYDSYDAGYEDVYENDDYDWDRYYSDDDYADGVDDAMDELDW